MVRIKENEVCLSGVSQDRGQLEDKCLSPEARAMSALHQNRNLEHPSKKEKRRWGEVGECTSQSTPN